MVETLSTMMLPLGSPAPELELPDAEGKTWSLASFEGSQALLVAFICNHCPFVKHIRAGFAKLANEYGLKGVAIVAINSNDYRNYPDDAPERMIEEAREHGYGFPYLVDESQQVAKSFRAACTPDFYVFDAERKLVYRGQLDDSRPGNSRPVTGADLRAALDAVLQGRPAAIDQKPSIGCNIKWKPGNAPEYFKS